MKGRLGTSSQVKTAWTPGTASALSLRMALMLRVRVRRADDLEVEHPLHLDVHRVMGVAGDDRPRQRGLARLAPHAWPARSSSTRSNAADRVLDRVIAGAAAEVPLEMERQVLLLLLGEARRRHDHPRGAEAALERLGVEERLLHRMEFAVAGQAPGAW